MKKFDPEIFMAAVCSEAGEEPIRKATFKQACRLLPLKDEEFLNRAYELLLHRKPDATGLAGYTPRAGTLTGRFCILLALYFSKERSSPGAWHAYILDKFR